MEQSGEAAESDQPGSQPLPLPPPQVSGGRGPDGDADGDGRRGLLIAAVLALVAVVGAIAWAARPDDGLAVVDRQEDRFPTPTTQAPPTTTASAVSSAAGTVAVPSTLPAVTVPAVDAVPATPVPTPPPGSTPAGELPTEPAGSAPPEDSSYIAQLVPNVAAFGELLSTPELAKVQVDQLLASGRHDVATPGPVATVCAALRMDRPLATRGRWERDGRRIATTGLERRDSPGFGECLANDGDELDVGSYQYVATDSNGNESAAGGIVIGAGRIDQRFRNDGDAAVCTVRIAPSVSRYFEVYVFTAQPVEPGAEITLPVADVEQDVQAVGCDGEQLASFSFEPAADAVRSLAP